MNKVVIIGKQQPRHIREYMKDIIDKSGYGADLFDPETRNTLDFKEQLKGYEVIISCGEKIPAEVMCYLADDLRLISRFGVGTDEMDHAEATKQGIAICNAAGVFASVVAECALGLMINILRKFPQGDAEVRRGDWSRFFEGRIGNQIEGKTVGLIGFGEIAQALAKMLVGFDCNVIAYDLKWNQKAADKYNVKYAVIEEILKESDIVSLHVPSTPSTRGMVNLEFLKKMKPTAVLINTGRGSLVVEEELAYALETGIIAGAGLDVFVKEPLPVESPLIQLDNVMLLPHLGAGSMESVLNAGVYAAKNAIDFLDGKQVKTILNPDYKNNL